ncbi:MAG TPA: quaternary ammonium compound efflux SMR transporter SugE [Nitrospira sp.]|nr:quaternary ammonium compound efflux SMR transporter SugE [Nitrospira sp.]
MMAWWYLLAAGMFEVVWASSLKFTDGFTRWWPSLWTVLAMIASFLLLAQALKSIPMGTGYAVWTGIGAAGTAVVGMLLFGESRDAFRLVSLSLIVAGILGLKLSVP